MKVLMLKRVLPVLILTCTFFSLSSCNEGFLYYNELREKGKIDKDVAIKTIVSSSQLDILWIIDNSGSMGSHQQRVIDNTTTFMQLFFDKRLNWKMGLLSTSDYQTPYIGFTPDKPLNSTMPDAVAKFQAAVRALGTSGSSTEKTFQPLVDKLTRFPDFVRVGSAFAVIMVTDAAEQSGAARDWLTEFKKATSNASGVYGYGVFASADFGCSGEGFNYAGSPYETFLKGLDAYKTLTLCDPDFGKVLAEISNDLVSRAAYYWIPLPFRPKAKTIVVSYKGVPLVPGPKEVGGLWYYNYDKNAIIFYDLDFAGGETDQVHVYAEEDNGIEFTE